MPKITYIILAIKYGGGIDRAMAIPAPRTDLLNPLDYD